jgi:hypothetical protein
VAATEGARFLVRRRTVRTTSWIVTGASLLGGRVLQAQSFAELRTLFYSESGGRTQVQNSNLLLHQDLGEALGQVDLLLSHDTVSGASPSGAYPTLSVTTTTSASGTSSTNASGQIPTVPYSDQRNGQSLGYSLRIGAHLPRIDLSHSVEKDYIARGFGLSDAWTMAGGRGTLHYGLSWDDDTVAPVTTPLRFAKHSRGAALGWTWVLGENDLVDVSISRTKLDGDLDEPYLVVPVGAGTVPEHRPGSRTRDALLLKQGHYFDDWDGALKTTYRFYRDDWGLKAHTLEFTYDQHLDNGWIVSPRLRLYTQNNASFYGGYFATAQPFMSADYRLSAFRSALVGCALTLPVTDGLTLRLGGSYQFQQGTHPLTPMAAAPTATLPPVFAGPGTSAADLNTATFTVGLKWQY